MDIALRYALVFLSLFTLLSSPAEAQFTQPCVDSTQADAFFQCNDASFLPVCGCNRKTYRNECVAFRNYGVKLIDHDGVCQEDYMFAQIYPNQVIDNINLYLQFFDKGPATIQIRNSFGNLLLTQNFLSLSSRQFSYDASSYDSGVYFVFILSGRANIVLKFVKI